MSVHTIKIVVQYDESQPIPSGSDLYRSITNAVGSGLLNPSGEEIVDSYEVEVSDDVRRVSEPDSGSLLGRSVVKT